MLLSRPVSLSVFLVAFGVSAQDHQSDYYRSLHEKDTAAQAVNLRRWEAASPNDAELFVAQFNFYINRAKQEIIVIDPESAEGDDVLAISDGGQTVGTIHGQTTWDKDLSAKALASIRKGIALYPDRLDMRFGCVHFLGLTEDTDGVVREIVATIERSTKNGNAWLWSQGKPVGEPPTSAKDPREFMLSIVQTYVGQLYENGRGKEIRTIAEAVLAVYPDHVESLSNLAFTYILEEDFDRALELLKKAEKLGPEDAVVLGNIAWCCLSKGDKAGAKKYYKKVLKYGDVESKTFAEQQLKKLD